MTESMTREGNHSVRVVLTAGGGGGCGLGACACGRGCRTSSLQGTTLPLLWSMPARQRFLLWHSGGDAASGADIVVGAPAAVVEGAGGGQPWSHVWLWSVRTAASIARRCPCRRVCVCVPATAAAPPSAGSTAAAAAALRWGWWRGEC